MKHALIYTSFLLGAGAIVTLGFAYIGSPVTVPLGLLCLLVMWLIHRLAQEEPVTRLTEEEEDMRFDDEADRARYFRHQDTGTRWKWLPATGAHWCWSRGRWDFRKPEDSPGNLLTSRDWIETDQYGFPSSPAPGSPRALQGGRRLRVTLPPRVPGRLSNRTPP